MKNTFYIVTLFLLATSAFAQTKITEKELLGRWQMTSTTMGKSFIDLKNKTVKIDPEMAKEAGMSVEDMEALIKENMAAADKYLVFSPEMKIEMAIFDGVSETYTYTLSERDNNTILSVPNDELKIWFDGPNLRVMVPSDEMDMTATFEKVN